jgi:hypothetical protein
MSRSNQPDTDAKEEAQSGQTQKDRAARPTKFLPTDRIKFSRQLDLLRAYAAASASTGKVVTNQEVSRIMEMQASTVSLANPFFADVGFLQKFENGYAPTMDVISYSRAFEWNPETAARKLAPMLEQSWFMTALWPSLKMRPMRVDEALTVLAEEAQAPPKYRPQLKTLLEYLEVAGLITSENGDIRLMKTASTPADKPGEDGAPPKPSEGRDRENPAPRSSTPYSLSQPTNGVVQFHVSVKVDMTEFAGWDAERISAFFAGIAQVLAAKGSPTEDES